jgi:NADPH-dependent 2,4-dienoyl-CoA reductase/sulfur reductase-like enzyme
VSDAVALRAQLQSAAPIVVVGAGFIGCEVAATARTMGLAVHVVALDEEPMLRPLGRALGQGMRHRHEAHGVSFHLGQTVVTIEGADHVDSVTLSDGTQIDAGAVIEAVGSVPNVDWLAGNGLDLADGLLVDDAMRVVGAPVPMVAAGDVARHPNALFGGVARRVEHWAVPTDTGRRAGRSLAALLAGETPDSTAFAMLPSFWSDQYDYQLQSFGLPGLSAEAVVVEGDVDGPCIATYSDDTGLIGVVGVDRTADLVGYRRELLARAPGSV